MRVGPSDSETRLRVQTAGCCVGPMARVVSDAGNGGGTLRQVRAGKTNASEPLMRCRKDQMSPKPGPRLRYWDQSAGAALTAARVATGIEVA